MQAQLIGPNPAASPAACFICLLGHELHPNAVRSGESCEEAARVQ